MERIPIQSRSIAEVGYDPNSMVLEVQFNNGRRYHYLDLPEAIYIELMQSESKGNYLNVSIKPNYRCVPL